MKKSWSVILKSFKCILMIKNVFTREGKVRQQRRTVSYKLHSTSVILYFSVFLSASTRLLAQLYRLHLSIDACDPNTFLTKYERWPVTFSQLLTYQKRAVWSIIWLTTNYVFFCDMLRWKWKCQYPRKQTSRSCF